MLEEALQVQPPTHLLQQMLAVMLATTALANCFHSHQRRVVRRIWLSSKCSWVVRIGDFADLHACKNYELTLPMRLYESCATKVR